MKAIITKTRAAAATFAGMLGLFGTAGTAHAQFVVHDPTSFAVQIPDYAIQYASQLGDVATAAERFQQLAQMYAVADQTYSAISGFRSSGLNLSLSGVADNLLSRSLAPTGPDADCIDSLVLNGDGAAEARESFVKNYGYKSLTDVYTECTPQYNSEKGYRESVLLAMHQGLKTNEIWTEEDRKGEMDRLLNEVSVFNSDTDPADIESKRLEIQALELRMQSEMHQMLMMQMNMEAAKNNLDASQRARRKRMFIQ